MPKNRSYNRLEELFSKAGSAEPEPPIHESLRPSERGEKDADRVESISAGTAAEPRALPESAWGEFLDGIRRGRHLGYAADAQHNLTPLTEILDENQTGTIAARLEVGGQEIGVLALEKPEHDQWSEDETQLIESVAQRLAQQVENLRLLQESDRYRSEAEAAVRRLTRQSWMEYLLGHTQSEFGFVFDQYQVTELTPANAPVGEQLLKLPLKVREQSVGEVNIAPAHPLDAEVMNLAETVTRRLSEHLESLRLTEQRESALSETNLLYNASARLSTATDLREALDAVIQPAVETGAVDARLLVINVDEEDGREKATFSAYWQRQNNPPPFVMGTVIYPREAHFTSLWLSDPQNPLLVSNTATDARFDQDAQTRQVFLQTRVLATAILPLVISGAWIGVIIINWDQPHEFGALEERLYRALSSQAAIVVNNLLLLEQTRRRAAELETVARVSTATSSLLSPQDLLETVVNLTRSSFNLYHVQAFLVEEDGLNLLPAAGSGKVGAQIAADRQRIVLSNPRALLARAARERQPIIANDVRTEPGYMVHKLLPDTRAELVIPMIVGERLLGVLDVQSDVVNRFTREDARTFTTLASQISVALQNAELYAEQERTVTRLRELDHLKSSFLANMSHELRTPLNSILGFADVIVLGLDGPLTDNMSSDLKLIQKNGKHLLNLINDVLDMVKIDAGRLNLNFEPFDLRGVLEETVDITNSQAREKSLFVQFEDLPSEPMKIVADRVRLNQVMINILGNAIKFTETGGITIRAERVDGKYRIAVRDTGIGIPPDKLEMIFEAFGQVDTSTTRKAGGTGLGLPISRRLVTLQGGRLWAESGGIPGEGSTFFIELPLEAQYVDVDVKA